MLISSLAFAGSAAGGGRALKALRTLVTGAGLLALWQAVVTVTGAPHFILPGPVRVAAAAAAHAAVLLGHAWVTLAEILLGLAIGCGVGAAAALALMAFRPVRRWLLPSCQQVQRH